MYDKFNICVRRFLLNEAKSFRCAQKKAEENFRSLRSRLFLHLSLFLKGKKAKFVVSYVQLNQILMKWLNPKNVFYIIEEHN